MHGRSKIYLNRMIEGGGKDGNDKITSITIQFYLLLLHLWLTALKTKMLISKLFLFYYFLTFS